MDWGIQKHENIHSLDRKVIVELIEHIEVHEGNRIEIFSSIRTNVPEQFGTSANCRRLLSCRQQFKEG